MGQTSNLKKLARESGGLAMLAVDQREALREMLQTARGRSHVSNREIVDFKTYATEILSPHASAVLLDKEFALDHVVEQNVIADGCALIASADCFHPGNGIPVDRVTIDEKSSPQHAKELGAEAMKLLVLWRADESPENRLEMVNQFISRCHDNGLKAIIEPVVRPPRTQGLFDKEESILAAADELGSTDADLYKGEMPRNGAGTDEELFTACRALDERITIPWVVLSSGVAPDDFPNAVRQAVKAGAQGFLAGRAVWAPTLSFENSSIALADLAVPRLKRLGEIVDEALAAREETSLSQDSAEKGTER